MNVAELARWLAGHRPSPAKLVAIVEGAEHPLKIAAGTHRWTRAAKLVHELNAEAVRLYDKSGELLDSCTLQNTSAGVDDDVEPSARSSSSSTRVDDHVRIINVVADAFARVARDATAAQAEAHSTAFKELSRVTEVATSRLVSLEQFVHSFLQQRAQELEQRAAEVHEAEEEADASGVNPLLETAMEKLAEKIQARKTDNVVDETVKDAVASGVKNGAKKNGAASHEGANGARKK